MRTGLRLAGVPDFLKDSDFAERNRLSSDEVRSLMFGHRLHGKSRMTGAERFASITKDGIASMSGDWVPGGLAFAGGAAEIKGGELCVRFGASIYCGSVLRNSGGTRAKKNEFIWMLFSFSQME